MIFAYGVSSNSTSILCEWNSVLVKQDILQISLSFWDGKSLNCLSNFSAVLVVDSDVSTPCLSGY